MAPSPYQSGGGQIIDMTECVDIINFSVAIAGFTGACLGLLITLFFPYFEKIQRQYFVVFFSLIILYIASDITSQISLILLGSDYSVLSGIAIFGESFFSSLLMPVLTFFIISSTGSDPRKNLKSYISVALWLSYFILLIVTQFTSSIYYITDDNVYHRGPLYPLLLVPPVLLMAANLTVLLRSGSRLSPRRFYALLVFVLTPLVCAVIQMFSYGLLIIALGTSASALFMVVFILGNQVEIYIRQKERNLSQQQSITVLQMRPHFIYNTLMSIYYLCRQDADKAQNVILNFSNYLKKNFTAIAKDETIPFLEELEHTKAYIAVEQVRHEGKLLISYDTPAVNFRLPPLTLQPIVENSVKHGVDPELDTLNILIRTRETAEGITVTVEDTGPGFVSTDNDEPHIALKNIKERLEIMCGGKLEIGETEGGGTTVNIFLPQKIS